MKICVPRCHKEVHENPIFLSKSDIFNSLSIKNIITYPTCDLYLLTNVCNCKQALAQTVKNRKQHYNMKNLNSLTTAKHCQFYN